MIRLSGFHPFFVSLAALVIFQADIAAQANLVLRAGPNYSDVATYKSTPEAPDILIADELAGFHLGLGLQNILSKKWAWEVELLYTGKGIKIRNFSFEGDQQRFSYLSIPLSATFRPIPVMGIRGGFEMGYLISSPPPTGFFVIPDTDHKFDLGYVAGLVFYPASKWSVEFRFARGLTPLSILSIFDFGPGGESEIKWYNRAIQLSATFLLGGPGN